METSTAARRYFAYGLIFDSELALPELAEAPASAGLEPAAICIRYGAAAIGTDLPVTQIGPFMHASSRELAFRVPDIASYLIRDGREIWIAPDAGSDEDSIRIFLLGAAIGTALHQRGLLVLHGNAIEIDGQCLICVGRSGVGKSTLAASFVQRGHRILADDVVAVNAQGMALPGFPRIKLWQDAADGLSIATGELSRVRPDMEKFHYPVHAAFADQPLPVRWIYALRTDNDDTLRFEPLSGTARFATLSNNTYRSPFVEGMGLSARNLGLWSALSGQIQLTRVTRPESGCAPDQLADQLLAHLQQHP